MKKIIDQRTRSSVSRRSIASMGIRSIPATVDGFADAFKKAILAGETMSEKEHLYDVLIFEFKTRKVDTIAGEAMRKSSGRFNADRRLLTLLNDDYRAIIVPTGRYKVGDVIPVEGE